MIMVDGLIQCPAPGPEPGDSSTKGGRKIRRRTRRRRRRRIQRKTRHRMRGGRKRKKDETKEDEEKKGTKKQIDVAKKAGEVGAKTAIILHGVTKNVGQQAQKTVKKGKRFFLIQ